MKQYTNGFFNGLTKISKEDFKLMIDNLNPTVKKFNEILKENFDNEA
jgi:hypothetical protein